MRRIDKIFRTLFVFFIFAAAGCGSATEKDKKNPGFEHFRVFFEQNGVPQEIVSGAVALEKKPFDIIIHFPGPDSVFVSASYDSDSYNAALSGEPLSAIKGFDETGMAEELFNKDETLMLSESAPHYWHYLDQNDHRFSEIIAADAYFVCRKKISFVSTEDNRGRPVEISKIKKKEIYLVFMKLDWNKDFTDKNEFKRLPLKIIFK